jgi:DNA-binding MarR family transcriptional regulator
VALVEALFAVTREVGRRRPDDNLDRAAVAILAAVADDGPVRISDVAGALGVDLSTVSRHAQALHAGGYLAKSADPVDGRACLVSATGPGRRLLNAVRRQRAERLNRALEGWPEEDRAALTRLLSRLAADLTGMRGTR